MADKKPRIKAGRITPRDGKAHLIAPADIADAKQWTARLSQPGRALIGKTKVTIPPKRARQFWQ